MTEIKKELFGDVDDSGIEPEGLMPPSQAPEGFELEEWQELTEVFNTAINNSLC
jgi:hypothetical protein